MYIQKKKNAFYLRKSVWNKDKQKADTSCEYLGSGSHNAIAKLKTIVSPVEFLELADKITAMSMPTPTEIIDKALERIKHCKSQAYSVDDELHTILLECEQKLELHKFRLNKKANEVTAEAREEQIILPTM